MEMKLFKAFLFASVVFRTMLLIVNCMWIVASYSLKIMVLFIAPGSAEKVSKKMYYRCASFFQNLILLNI